MQFPEVAVVGKAEIILSSLWSSLTVFTPCPPAHTALPRPVCRSGNITPGQEVPQRAKAASACGAVQVARCARLRLELGALVPGESRQRETLRWIFVAPQVRVTVLPLQGAILCTPMHGPDNTSI